MLLAKIKAALSASLKAGDTRRVETLRFLLSHIHNAAIAQYGARGEEALTDADILDVIQQQVNSHKQSIEIYEKAGRNDLAEKEREELAILETYRVP